VEAPASLLGGGREAEILDLGDGTVLRRYRGVGFPERAGLVMEHARRHGERAAVRRLLERALR